MHGALTMDIEQTGGNGPLTVSEFRNELLAAMPVLRRYARSLTDRHDRIDDLVQETLMRAWSHRISFRAGTNLEAWLVTILKNEFCTYLRKARHEVEDPDGLYARDCAVLPNQYYHVELTALNAALSKLPDGQKKALSLVVLSGFPYAKAAKACHVKVGTVKSRIKRARERLAQLLETEGSHDFGSDTAVQGVVAGLRSQHMN